MYGINDTSFKKYRLWRGIGTNVSAKSRLGMEIEASNKNNRNISKYEVEKVTKDKKAFNAIFFWSLSNILEYMARNGKIRGIYLNMKQGWHFEDVTHDEIKTKNKLEWKVRYENYEEFLEDINMIREYRLYHTDIHNEKEGTINFLEDLMQDEWTMNVIDGNVTRKHLWHKYRMDTIKIMNLEFRIRDDVTNKGVTEIPLVFCEDNGDYNVKRYDERKLQLLENKWNVANVTTNIPNKKKKKQPGPKNKIKTKQIRFGTEELLKETLEVKKLLLSLKEKPVCNNEMATFDKFDQLKEVENTIFDDETKEKMIQIIISRKDKDDLQYKTLEEELLTGKNYTVNMPKIETIRNNILGMVQVIEENAPEKWPDHTLGQRLQKITGNRMKKLISYNLQEIVRVLVTFKKEMQIVNELKSQCESKNNFNLVQFTDLLKQIVGEKEYENERIEFMDRWCDEIEANLEKGMTETKICNMNEPSTSKQHKQPMCSTVKKASKRRFVLSSDSEDSFIIPKTAKMTRTRNKVKAITEKEVTMNEEEIIISSDSYHEISNSDSNSDVIPKENITYMEFSSEDEDN